MFPETSRVCFLNRESEAADASADPLAPAPLPAHKRGQRIPDAQVREGL